MRDPIATYKHEAKRRATLSAAYDAAESAHDRDRAQTVRHLLGWCERRVERAHTAWIEMIDASREDEDNMRRESTRASR